MDDLDAMDIQDIARRLYEAHGPRAAAEAARKAQEQEAAGDAGDAEAWRRVEAALIRRIGPHVS